MILLFEARLWLRDVAISNVLGQLGAFALIVGVDRSPASARCSGSSARRC